MDDKKIKSSEKIREGKNFQESHCIAFVLTVTIAVVGVIEIIWLAIYGNKPEIYTDVVLEELAAEFANKSSELKLYWIGMVIGLLIISGIVWCMRKRIQIECLASKIDRQFYIVTAGIVGLLIGEYTFFGYVNSVIVFALMIDLVAYLICKETVLQAVCCYVVMIYSLSGLFRLYVWLGGNSTVNLNIVIIVSFVLTMIIGVLCKGKYDKALIVEQFGVPPLLLIYLLDKYTYQGETYTISPRKSVGITIFFLIIVAYVELGYIIKKRWKRPDENIIGYFTVVCTMAFNRFSGSAYIMLEDMHHPAENTIAYNEITNLGRQAFSEYVPISGLYSWVQGLFLELFGGGNYTEYSLANNMFYLAIILLLVFALRLHLNSLWTIVIAVCIYVSDYSRVALIIPFMLILMSPKLTKHTNLWYMVWVLMGWCYGLYYPAYGAAIIVAMLPMAVNMFPKLIQVWKRMSRCKRTLWVVLWVFLFVGILYSMPLILGTIEHVIAMGDGMLYVDGVTIFGQTPPSDFLGYMNNNSVWYTVRMICGYVVRFTGPMLVIWITYCSVINIFKGRVNGKITIKSFWGGLTLGESSVLSCLIFPIVCFYFSLYRMGQNNLFNRATYIIDASLILLIVILIKYGKKSKGTLVLIMIATLVCTLGNINGLNAVEGKYYTSYMVPDDYTYVAETQDYLPRLGIGFVQQDLLIPIEEAGMRYSEMDQNRNYFALFSNGDHGMAYDEILNIKGTGMLESLVVRGYSITCDTAQKLIKSDTIVGNRISPVDHYYLWKWLVSGGDYVWSDSEQLFYPVKDESIDQIRENNANAMAGMATYDTGKYAASLGNSIGTLDEVLTEKKVSGNTHDDEDSYRVDFYEVIDGNEIDYIYLSLDVDESYRAFLMGDDHTSNNWIENALMKHEYNEGMCVVVEWQAQDGNVYNLRSKMENGQLLIPIGAGVKWLSNNHSYIRIWCEKEGQKIGMPAIEDIRYYSVRELRLD